MPTDKACEECGAAFVAKTKRARFCKPACRVRANRRPAREGAAAAQAGQEPPETPERASYDRGGLLGQVVADLSSVGVLDTIPGKAALALAYRIESPMETGSAAASMTRELSRLVAEARALSDRQDDRIDALDAGVAAKLRLVQ